MADPRKAFDWNTRVKFQLAGLEYVPDPTNMVVFVVAQSSTKGSAERNVRLARERMLNVAAFVKETLHIRSRAFRGAWLGSTILQLNASDATVLGIKPIDYRDDVMILNQSVHVFIFPCADRL